MPALLVLVLCVTGCDQMERDMREGGEALDSVYDDTRYKLSNYLYDHEARAARLSAAEPERRPASFCYRLMMDLLCYSEPQPHLHLNLVAVQGEHDYAYEDFLPDNVLEQEGMKQASMTKLNNTPGIEVSDLEPGEPLVPQKLME
jgi:hypothetical protein